MNTAKNIIIRGKRNSGKSYLIMRIISLYNSKIKMAGFFTKKTETGHVTFKVWDNFDLMDEGPSMVIYDANDKIIRENVFEELGVWAIIRALKLSEIIVIDELGRFEKDCKNFIQTVHTAFSHDIPLIASIKNENNPFLNSLLERNDIKLFMMNRNNRNNIYNRIILTMNELKIPE